MYKNFVDSDSLHSGPHQNIFLPQIDVGEHPFDNAMVSNVDQGNSEQSTPFKKVTKVLQGGEIVAIGKRYESTQAFVAHARAETWKLPPDAELSISSTNEPEVDLNPAVGEYESKMASLQLGGDTTIGSHMPCTPRRQPV
eukprot:CAMPEP_0181323484 /NCGR_PEP_ID=MMETSP1101-20121128/19815_1 /TAXON_ID=46948 /ORGANISM="Rhodomonas abbreviata, Strain Caron Lab Isolate" /LENGTH=139 /DNA_ID=CAMNT_0023431525 /DNA_START=305 /DNA_END=724 /DNA_ORIENTATION=+